eukprot:6194520-Amphidinium_carterae.2
MKQNEKRLLTASRWWAHDAKVIENVCTDSAQCALLSDWTVRCMPSVERCIDVATSLRNSNEFMQSTAFKWAAHGVKSQVKACHAWLLALHENVPPTKSSQATPWVAEQWLRLPFFVRDAVLKTEPSDDDACPKVVTPTPCFGADALTERWEKEKAVKEKTVEACRFFVIWSFFMPVSFQEEVRAALVKLKADGS